MRPEPHHARRLLTALLIAQALLAGLTGCPQPGDEAAVVTTCAKVGQRCRMSGNQLGVCAAGPSAGALVCAAQH